MKFKICKSHSKRKNHIKVTMWFKEDNYYTSRFSHTRIEEEKIASP